jgi:hypothetical protein
MIYPIDNSTDPPFRYITKAAIEDEFGKMSKMTPRDAIDVLGALAAPHWLCSDESEAVKKELATRAKILNDLEALENFGLEDLLVRYKVMVDDNFHYMDESERHEHGVFATAQEAIAACKRIVDENLKNSYKPGITEQELYEAYTSFGDDPFVVPVDNTDKAVHFSAWDYARERCPALTSAIS